ncbi:MAG: acetyl-CoA carboxylase biotin carboxylase subunit [Ardenticatenales bacterium]|nr:acetyl-CoA carboxylase biotin carboxylase subunit [Ardenticatenales bacterium]
MQKVLIANRGEIAVRIIRAAQELGYATVAVYSDGDRAALHVRLADEAFNIGPSPAAESYLRIDRILDVARRSGATLVHPGYGFLAENQAFAQAVIDAGLRFVGPPPSAIHAMGDKVRARQAMIAAGVPVVPGTAEGLTDDEVLAQAPGIGFPVLIKASAGGGGKGMRRVDKADDLVDALAAARRESAKAFGDDTVYLEKLVEGARHVEIQVLGDQHGHVIHLGERECSMQRRHQKVLEECPSPAVTTVLRERMGAAAVAAAKAVGYYSAGTCEFLLDENGEDFYFLEMNTRLQVEHPVTEVVTGVDLVKHMLRIALGRKLRLTQEHVRWTGHAIECRINAEDPFHNFLPSTGRVTSLQEPSGPGVRVDSALFEGYEVSLYYDPMVAKLIVHGQTRPDAILRMRRALAEYRIAGIRTTIPLHQRLMDMTQFISGSYDTSYLEHHFTMTHVEGRDFDRVAAITATLLAHQHRSDAINRLAPVGDSEWKRFGRRQGMRVSS